MQCLFRLIIFKARYQRELIKNVEAIQEKLDPSQENITGLHLFTILVTVVSLRNIDNESIDISLLDNLTKTLNLSSTQDLWCKYTRNVLIALNKDPQAWLVVTPERCILETVLMESGAVYKIGNSFVDFILHTLGEALGENLDIIGEILTKTLDTEADAEARLKTFVALSVALENKDKVFRNAKDLNEFLETLVSGM